MKTPISRGPNCTFPFHIHTYELDMEIGIALRQLEDKIPYVIYFISKKLSKVELKNIVIIKEFLIIVYSLNKFFHYVISYQVIMHDDHEKIKYLMNKPYVNYCIISWLVLLQ